VYDFDAVIIPACFIEVFYLYIVFAYVVRLSYNYCSFIRFRYTIKRSIQQQTTVY